jgi:hypothetical protein
MRDFVSGNPNYIYKKDNLEENDANNDIKILFVGKKVYVLSPSKLEFGGL